MVNNIRKRRLNNNGSTLVLVLIIVSFIGILGTVCIATALVNLRMKAADRESKKTFYTAEEAIDEIYTSLGKLSMEKLNTSYVDVMSQLSQHTSITGYSTAKMGNTAANALLRQEYTELMAGELSGIANVWSRTDGDKIFSDSCRDTLINKLNSYLEKNSSNETNATVESIGEFSLKKVDTTVDGTGVAMYQINFSDCLVRYVSKDNGFFSQVTFDGVIGFPDSLVAFTDDTNVINKSFEDYALIANNGIDLNGKKLNLNSSAFSGTNGFNLSTGAEINITGTATKPAMMVTMGDLKLSGSRMNAVRSNIWCVNINLNSGSASTMTADDNSDLYVKDDLQVDGDNSNVSISGDYYGYGYEGNASTATGVGHANSSAININGAGANVDLRSNRSEKQNIIVGGRSYVDYASGVTTYSSYVTGESLSLKGNQEVYLVPSILITDSQGKQLTNPVATDAKYNSATINLKTDTFFGFSYLNASQPYKEIAIGTEHYLLLNFSSKQAATDYFKAIMNDDAFNALCSQHATDASTLSKYRSTRSYMQNLIRLNTTYLKQKLQVNADSSNIYVNGALLNAVYTEQTVNGVTKSETVINDVPSVSGGIKEISDVAGMGVDTFSILATDMRIRYGILCKSLYQLPMYIDPNAAVKQRALFYTEPTSIVVNGTDSVSLTSMSNSIFTNIINLSYFNQQMVASGTHKDVMTNNANRTTIYVTDSDLTVSAASGFGTYNNGIIISSGTVTVETDFHGLIIAGNSIIINSDVTVDNKISGYAGIEDFINAYPAYKSYFVAWNRIAPTPGPGVTGQSIAGMTYKNLVSFENWKKTDINSPITGIN